MNNGNGNVADHIEQEVRSITDTMAATGLPATPPAESPAVYGGDAAHAAVETAAAIERACEAAIAEFLRGADNAEALARQVRAEADSFATKLRAYTSGFTGHLSDFLVYCQQASNMAHQHSQEFEEKIQGLLYPRAKNGNH